MKPLALLISLVAWLPGCGDDQPAVVKTGPLVTYERGGGIASMPQKLVVARDGSAKYEVRTGPKLDHSAFTLSPAQLSELEDALDAAAGTETPEQTGYCADCFTFSVTATGIDIDLDQVTMEDTTDEMRALVSELDSLLPSQP